MTHWVFTAALFILGLALGGALVTWVPWFKTHKGDTALFFKQKVSPVRFFILPTIICTVLTAIAVLQADFESITEFATIEMRGEYVGERKYQLANRKKWIVALVTAYAFINPSWQRAREKANGTNGTHTPPQGR